MAKKSTGTGRGGKTYEERELAKHVRNLTLKEMASILEEKGLTEMKKQLVLRLAGTVLPRLTVLQGDEDGGPVKIEGVEITVRKK